LTLQRRLIAAQPVEGIGRQVGQADKGSCEIVGLANRLHGRQWARINSTCGRYVLILSHIVFGRDGVSVYGVDDFLALLMGLLPLPELKQVFRLDLEQAALDGGGTTQPP
jgi:hypothetical protein